MYRISEYKITKSQIILNILHDTFKSATKLRKYNELEIGYGLGNLKSYIGADNDKNIIKMAKLNKHPLYDNLTFI